MSSFVRKFATVSESTKKIIFSGIQPSGIPHIGNYFGALKNWVQLQKLSDGMELDKYKELLSLEQNKIYFGIMSYHALTTQNDPQLLHDNILRGYVSLLSCGLKSTENSILFVQSEIPEHCELMWILSCIAKIGKLSRMTQYKQKTQTKNKNDISLGLLAYPVLMAADIILYDATHIPVGEDQIQHVELCRDLLIQFNTKYNTNIPLPEYILPEQNEKRIMSLANGKEKMSKSSPNENSRILITDSPETIQRVIKKAKSDSLPTISFDENRPEVVNLLTIMSAATNTSIEEVSKEWTGKTMSQFKPALSDALIECLRPIREQYDYYMKDVEAVRQMMSKEQERINSIAHENMNKIKKAVGLYL